MIAFNPVFQTEGGTGVVQFEKVHIVLRHADGSIALDKVVDFPADAESITLELPVQLSATAPPSGEDLTLSLEMLNHEGQVVFTGGPITVHAVQGSTPPPPVNIPTTYTGPGSTATKVTVSPPSATILPSGTADFTGTAFDASDAVLPGTPIVWTSSDPTVATIPDIAIGHVVAGTKRGTTTITANLLTGQTATASLTVRPNPSAIAVGSGEAQSAAVGAPMPLPLQAKVTATDGLGIDGVPVTFAVQTGGGALSTALPVTTDAQGLASIGYTCGTTPGTVIVTASAAGLTGSPVTFTLFCAAGPVAQFVFTTQPVTTVVLTTMPPVVVELRDSFGNKATGFTGLVTVALDAPPAGVTLTGTLSVNAVAGVATFSSLQVSAPASAQRLRASATGVAATGLSAGFDIVPPPPTQLVITTQPANTKTGKEVPVTVEARTSTNTLATNFNFPALVTVLTGPTGAVLTGGTGAFVNGVASFNVALSLPGTYQLAIVVSGLPTAVTASFTVVTSAATAVNIVSGSGQTGAASLQLPLPLVVQVVDGAGDPVAGVTVAWSVTSGGGSVNPLTTTTDATGTAATNWTLGTIGTQTAQAVAGALPPATFSATLTAPLALKTWTGAISTAWSTAGNWNPAGVPASTDTAFIPLTANNPVLSAAITLAGLRIAPTASLSILANNVTITGSVDAGTTIIGGGGTVNLTGTGTLKGVINAPVTISGTYTANGATSISGNVLISGGQLVMGSQTVTVTGTLSTTAGGTIKLVTAADALTVTGNISFGGGSEAGLLTNGVLTAGANITCAFGCYVAAGTALLRFNGASVQTVSGSGMLYQSIDFAGAGGVTFASTATSASINGSVTIQATSGPVSGHVQLFLNQGSLSDASGGAKWLVDSLSFGGCACVITLPAAVHGILRGQGNVSLGSSFTADSMEVYSGTITWNGQSVTVLGDFRTTGNGSYSMSSAGDALTVTGNATFNGSVTAMTAGNTTFKGNFTQLATFNGRSYQSQAGHTTTFTGNTAQTISFATSDTTFAALCGGSCFGNLSINKASGTVTFLSRAGIQGNLTINSGVSSVSAVNVGRVAVKGNVTTGTGTFVHFSRFGIRGTLALDTTTVIDTIIFHGGAAQTVPNRIFSAVGIHGAPTVASNLFVGGILVDSGAFSPGGHTVLVTPQVVNGSGNFGTTGTGVLAMTNATDSLIVNGVIVLGGGASAPSAGIILARGNFTATGATFQASGTNILLMADTALALGQTLSYTAPLANVGIRHLHFDGMGQKTVAGTPTILGDVVLRPASDSVVGPGAAALIGGNLIDSTLIALGGGWQVASTAMNAIGGQATLSVVAVTTNLSITGGEVLADSSLAIHLIGNLAATGATAVFNVHASFVVVDSSFATASGGKLKMVDPNGFDDLEIHGNATFAGGSTAGLLTNGLLTIDGGFSQSGAGDSFSADSTMDTHLGLATFCCALRAGTPGASVQASNLRLRPNQLKSFAHIDSVRQAALRGPKGIAYRRALDARTARLKARQNAIQARRAALIQRTSARLRARGASTALVRAQQMKMIASDSIVRVGGRANIFISALTFATPGYAAGQSHFGSLYINGDEIDVGSDIFVQGELESGNPPHHLVSPSPRVMTSTGASVDGMTFDNVRWVLLDGNNASAGPQFNVSFINMDPTVDQLTVQRDGNQPPCDCSAALTFWFWNFSTTPTTGHYISATDTDGASPSLLFLDMVSPFPATNGGFLQLINGAQSNWPATFDWTGLGATAAWTDGGNWTTGFAPFISDDVTILASAPHMPDLDFAATVHNLTVQPGATIELDDEDLDVYGNLVTPLGAPSIVCVVSEAGYLHLIGDGTVGGNSVVANVGDMCSVFVDGNYKVSGTGSQLVVGAFGTVWINGNLTVNGGRLDVGGVGGISQGQLATQGTGTLTMTNPADQVFVGNLGAYFEGGSTAGLLTAGTLTLVDGCVHTLAGIGAPDAFAPSGTHTVVFTGSATNVEFGDPTQSFFQNVSIDAAMAWTMFSDVNVHGTFAHTGTGTAQVIGASAPTSTWMLTTAGLTNTQPLQMVGVTGTFVDGTANKTFDNVAWMAFPASFTGNVFTVNRADATLTFNSHNFGAVTLSSAPQGHYLVNLGASAIHMATPTPSTATAGIEFLNSGTGSVIWP